MILGGAVVLQLLFVLAKEQSLFRSRGGLRKAQLASASAIAHPSAPLRLEGLPNANESQVR